MTTRPAFYGYRPYPNHADWQLIRSLGPHQWSVVYSRLTRRDAERLCLRANQLLARLRQTHVRVTP